jgi:hypothetical protein
VTIEVMNTDGLSTSWHGKAAAIACRVLGSVMRPLWLVLVGLIAGPAAADTSKTSTPPVSGDLFSNKADFYCAPSPLGSGTWPKLRSNAAGTVAWWYCPGARGGWSLSLAAATSANLSATKLWTELYAAMSAPDSVVAFHAMVAERVTMPMDDPRLKPVWQPFLSEMLAGVPARAAKASHEVAVN